MTHVQHHAYIFDPKRIEGAKLRAEAEARRDDRSRWTNFSGETTIVHTHAETFKKRANAKLEHPTPCNEGCLLYEPGYKPRHPNSTTKEPLEENE